MSRITRLTPRLGRVWRAALWLGVTPVLVIALYLLAAVLGGLVPGAHAAIEGGADVRIGLAKGPIHYDFLLPATPETRARFAFAENAGVPVFHPDAAWLIVGWGGRAFYTSVGTYHDISARAVWLGVTGDRSVMHLDAVGQIGSPPGVSYIWLSAAQYSALIDAIIGSFALETGQPVLLPDLGQNDTDAFYAGRGGFNILHTCNVWVGDMLRKAGVAFGGWTPTTWAVRLSLWRLG